MLGTIKEIIRPDPQKTLERLEHEQADLLSRQAQLWEQIGASEADGADTAALRAELAGINDTLTGKEAGLQAARSRVERHEADEKARIKVETDNKVRAIAVRREDRAVTIQGIADQMAGHLAADHADYAELFRLLPRIGDDHSRHALGFESGLRRYMGVHLGMRWAFASLLPASETPTLIESLREGHDLVLRDASPRSGG